MWRYQNTDELYHGEAWSYNSSDELYHYGIIGMRWGRRKAGFYQNKANIRIKKMKKSKTRLGKKFNNYLALKNEYKENVANAVRKEKGHIGKQIGNLYGHGDAAAFQKAAANYFARKAEYSKSRLGKTINKSREYNYNTYAKKNQRTHDTKGVVNKAKSALDTAFNTDEKTWSGRLRNSGKGLVDQILTGGTIGFAKDVNYYAKTKPKKKNK